MWVPPWDLGHLKDIHLVCVCVTEPGTARISHTCSTTTHTIGYTNQTETNHSILTPVLPAAAAAAAAAPRGSIPTTKLTTTQAMLGSGWARL